MRWSWNIGLTSAVSAELTVSDKRRKAILHPLPGNWLASSYPAPHTRQRSRRYQGGLMNPPLPPRPASQGVQRKLRPSKASEPRASLKRERPAFPFSVSSSYPRGPVLPLCLPLTLSATCHGHASGLAPMTLPGHCWEPRASTE